MELILEIGASRFAIESDERRAAGVLDVLRRHLPMEMPVHSPKIAGSHIYWHAPFLAELESGGDVMAAPPGAFLYWPERQFLEIVFAPLQAESAEVSLLGKLTAGLDELAGIAARLRQNQGRTVEFARLFEPQAAQSQVAGAEPGPLADLQTARHSLQTKISDEIVELLRRRGIMHPVGPMLFAESEARTLHESLFWLRNCESGSANKSYRRAAAIICRKSASRLGGFCHLSEISANLHAAADAFEDSTVRLEDVYRESILYVGRVSAWLDTCIPWNDFNNVLREVQGEKD